MPSCLCKPKPSDTALTRSTASFADAGDVHNRALLALRRVKQSRLHREEGLGAASVRGNLSSSVTPLHFILHLN